MTFFKSTSALFICGLMMPAAATAADIEAKMQAHPAVAAAAHAYCATGYGVNVQRAGYLPQVDFKLSGSDKTVDETTRSDAYGGENSPEYDGDGLDAELNLSQNIYDWGKTGADVAIAKSQRKKEQLAYSLAIEEQVLKLINGVVLHQSQEKAVNELNRNVKRLQANRAAISEQVRLGYTGKRILNDYDLLLIDRETARDEAAFKLSETVHDLQTNFDVKPADIPKIAGDYMAKRPQALVEVEALKTRGVKLLDEEIRIYKMQSKKLRAQTLPRMQAKLSARGWDLAESELCSDIAPLKENCQTHDVIGSVELTMPLFTGGAAQNQKRAAISKKSEMQARRSLLIRRSEQESVIAQKRFDVLANRYLASQEKADLLAGQLKIEKARQKTNAIRFDVIAELDSAMADARVAGLSISYELERMRAQQLVRAARLGDVMGVTQKAPSCGQGGY